jgi:protoporphyrinogen oxidase
VAGLAAALAAERRGLSYELFEAGPELGGNARTFEVDGFRFDAGAHRLHDRFPEVTACVQDLLGDALRRVDEKSRIQHAGGFVDFPLRPWDLVRKLSTRQCLRAGIDLVRARLGARGAPADLEQLALQRYGRAIAEPFLLRYSEKLWGYPAGQLSVEVAGSRLEGLGVRRILSGIQRTPGPSRHLEGSFLYPRDGIGSIAQAMVGACRRGALHTLAPVTAIEHDGRRVCAAVVRGGRRVEVQRVVSTLPLATQLALLAPAPAAECLEAARGLEFRNVILVAVFLRRARAERYASTYFPDPRWPFTRVHEPTVRSAAMAPPGHTSLVAELPCFASDAAWARDDEALAGLVTDALAEASMLTRADVIGTAVRRLHSAYPILRTGVAERVARARTGLDSLENLSLVGRVATFRYLHLHDLIRSSFAAVDRIVAEIDGEREPQPDAALQDLAVRR